MAGVFFDFDELEELEEALAQKASADRESGGDDGERGAAAEGPTLALGKRAVQEPEDDTLSEVWPDDLHGLESALDAEEEKPEDSDVSGDSVPWEVSFTRVVVRSRPELDAPVVAIRSRGEVVFEERGACPDARWVKVVDTGGFILKDGRVKDPTIPKLLKPFELPRKVAMPPDEQHQVMSSLKDAWACAREDHPLLSGGHIRTLHEATVAAFDAGDETWGFNFQKFDDALWRKAREIAPTAVARHRGTPNTDDDGGGEEAADVAPRTWASLVAAGTGGGASSSTLSYDAPGILSSVPKLSVDVEYAKRLTLSMKQRRLPHVQDVSKIITEVMRTCSALPSLTRLKVPHTATLRVVGDVHGQYWDLLHIFEEFGDPSQNNWYLFNGDLVDRGQFSVEVVLAVFVWKLALPDHVHINRGNHEAEWMNTLFGFQAEVKAKYNESVFSSFSSSFRSLPLATVVNDSVFIVHGGLGSAERLRLDDVERISRIREPREGDTVMVELLWSDPMERTGLGPSPRGGGVLFGPDVTARFCEENGLLCMIRSHEMRPRGYEWMHGGRCLTLFSAANYCGICANLGAVCSIQPRAGSDRLDKTDLQISTFDATPCPQEADGRPRFGHFDFLS